MKEKNRKLRLILRFFKGSKKYFVVAVLASLATTIFNALTPQIFRFSIDEVLKGDNHVFLSEHLWILSAILIGVAVLSGCSTFISRTNTAKAGENFAKNIGDNHVFLSEHLWILSAILIGVAVLSGCSTFISRTNTAKAGENFAKNMRDALFIHVQKLPMSWHDKNQTGDIIQRCTSDVEVIRNFVVTQLLEVFRTVFLVSVSFAIMFSMNVKLSLVALAFVPIVVAYSTIFYRLIAKRFTEADEAEGESFAIMFSMNVKLSLVALAFVPIVVAYSTIFYRLIAKRFTEADEAEGELSTVVQENATGVRVVRAFGREKFEMDRFQEKNDRFAKLWIRLGTISGLYWGVGDLIEI